MYVWVKPRPRAHTKRGLRFPPQLRIGSTGGTILIGDIRSARRKTCHSASLSTTDLTVTGPASKLVHRSERPTASIMNHDTASTVIAVTGFCTPGGWCSQWSTSWGQRNSTIPALRSTTISLKYPRSWCVDVYDIWIVQWYKNASVFCGLCKLLLDLKSYGL